MITRGAVRLSDGGDYPQGGGGTDLSGIGLVEVLWKAISNIINRQISSSVQFHDTLHLFRAKRGTGTATLEAKLLRQLAILG